MERRLLHSTATSVQESDDEEVKGIYSSPIPTTVDTNGGGTSRNRGVSVSVVPGSFLPRNLSSAQLITPDTPTSEANCRTEEHTGTSRTSYGSCDTQIGNKEESSNVERSDYNSEARQLNESDELLPHSRDYPKKRKRICNASICSILLIVSCVIFFLSTVIVLITVSQVYYSNIKEMSEIYNENDTILVTNINTTTVKKASFKLIPKQSQPIHVVTLYAMSCNVMKTHSSILYSSASFGINHVALVYLPIYLVTGSKFNIIGYVLNASRITTDITLYVFHGLHLLQNITGNLQKNIYSAPIYISGTGAQNTSTNINYTVSKIGYYFLVVDATTPIRLQLDVSLNRTFYDPSDYKEWCKIHNNVVCEFPSNNDEECILANTVNVPDIDWTPAYIEIEEEVNKLTLQLAMSIILFLAFGLALVPPVVVVIWCIRYYCRKSR